LSRLPWDVRPIKNKNSRAAKTSSVTRAQHAHDPWAGKFLDLIAEHAAERAVRDNTSVQMEFVYYPQSNCGVWFQRLSENYAVGLLDDITIKALSEIAAEHGFV
jgi:hypothetical protein